jgi:hypothetical protein
MSKISYGFRLRFIRIPLLTFVPSIFYFSGTEGKQAAFRKTILEGGQEVIDVWVFLILMK